MKRKLIKALVVLILLGAGGIAYQFYQTKQQSDALAFEAVDMNRLQDGSYEGECQTGLVQVRLRLRIQNAAIQRIELLQHDNGMGKDAEQTFQFDNIDLAAMEIYDLMDFDEDEGTNGTDSSDQAQA